MVTEDINDNSNEVERQHGILKEFIQAAGLTNVEFAEIAGVNKYSFQTMLRRGHSFKLDTYKKVFHAMHVITEKQTTEKTKNILFHLFWEFINEEGLVISVDEIFLLLQEFEHSPLAMNYSHSDLLTKYHVLNAEGQQKALEYMTDLLGNPKYQKKVGE